MVRTRTLPGSKEIARKSVSAQIARVAARKARDLARNRKGLLGNGGLPGKLIDCSSNEPEMCEIFIVEVTHAARLCPKRTRPGDAGDPADSRRDPQRRACAAGQGAREYRCRP